MSTPRGRGPLTPMNGTAGAGLACGIFGLLLAVAVGFAAFLFAIVAVAVGGVAIGLGARGQARARLAGGESRIASAAVITGALAALLGLAGVLVALL